MLERKSRKAINFDLFTKELKNFYPGTNYRHAYYDIKIFFIRHEFSHRQSLGYVSNHVISYQDVYNLIDGLSSRYPWLEECINKIDVTNIGEHYDSLEVLRNKPDVINI